MAALHSPVGRQQMENTWLCFDYFLRVAVENMREIRHFALYESVTPWLNRSLRGKMRKNVVFSNCSLRAVGDNNRKHVISHSKSQLSIRCIKYLLTLHSKRHDVTQNYLHKIMCTNIVYTNMFITYSWNQKTRYLAPEIPRRHMISIFDFHIFCDVVEFRVPNNVFFRNHPRRHKIRNSTTSQNMHDFDFRYVLWVVWHWKSRLRLPTQGARTYVRGSTGGTVHYVVLHSKSRLRHTTPEKIYMWFLTWKISDKFVITHTRLFCTGKVDYGTRHIEDHDISMTYEVRVVARAARQWV